MTGKNPLCRITLRTLLILMGFFGAMIGVYGKHRLNKRAELAAILEVRKVGGVLIYASTFDKKIRFRDHTQLGDRHLRYVSNIRYVTEVRLTGVNVSSDLLSHLSKVRTLRRLSLGKSTVDEKGLLHLRELRRLEHLDLQSTNISDLGLEHISRIKSLEFVHLGGTSIGDDGLKRLHSLVHLKHLRLEGTAATANGIELLTTAIPSLRVDFSTCRSSSSVWGSRIADRHPAMNRLIHAQMFWALRNSGKQTSRQTIS